MIKFKNIADSLPASVHVEIKKVFINKSKMIFDTVTLFNGLWGDLSNTDFDFKKYENWYCTLYPRCERNYTPVLVINLKD